MLTDFLDGTTARIRRRVPAPARVAAKRGWHLYRRRTAFGRALPDFLVIGGQRCGTTSLYDYLVAHPNVLPAAEKEVHYFSLHSARGIDWYRGHFPSEARRGYEQRRRRTPVITGEATPYYLFHPAVPERVRLLLPPVKLIALLRNPVDRAISAYHHEYQQGREKLDLDAALAREASRLAGEEERLLADPGAYSFEHHHYSYAARGRYAEQLQRWLRVFPREQLLVLRSDDLFENPAETYASVLDFLGLPPCDLELYPHANARAYDPASVATRNRLAKEFEEPNRQLEELVGRSFAW